MSTPELATFKPEPKKSNAKLVWSFVTFVAFVAGIWIGVASSGSEAEPAAVQPVPTVTATVTETDVQEVTPQVCLDALDIADEGFIVASEAMFAAQGTVEALLGSDLAGMEQSNAELTEAAEKLGPLADQYNEAKGNCRTAAK